MKSRKFKTHPVKQHKVSIYTRMKLRRLWYISVPIMLIAINGIASFTLWDEMKQGTAALQRKAEIAAMQEVTENTVHHDTYTESEYDKTATYNRTSITDTRLSTAGGGLSSITETQAVKLKHGVEYADLNKYNRAGVITAVIDASDLTDAGINTVDIEDPILTLNMLPKALGGTTQKTNNIQMVNDVYKDLYAPIMQDIYDYIKASNMTTVIKITPTWSNVQYQMPDTIRIDVYSLDDYGKSANANYIITNRAKNGNTDYINLENN